MKRCWLVLVVGISLGFDVRALQPQAVSAGLGVADRFPGTQSFWPRLWSFGAGGDVGQLVGAGLQLARSRLRRDVRAGLVPFDK